MPEQLTIRLSPLRFVALMPAVIFEYGRPRISSMIWFATPVAWTRSRPSATYRNPIVAV